jgi:hypothetical protein
MMAKAIVATIITLYLLLLLAISSSMANATDYVINLDTGSYGALVATGIIDNGTQLPVVDTSPVVNAPVVTPLPGTLALFASGLGALGLLGWRKKKAAAG